MLDRVDDATTTGEALRRRQRGRNWMLAAILLAFVVLFYVVTIVKLTGNVS